MNEYRVDLFRSLEDYQRNILSHPYYKVGKLDLAMYYAKEDVACQGKNAGNGFAVISAHVLPYRIFVEWDGEKVVVKKGTTTVDRQSLN